MEGYCMDCGCTDGYSFCPTCSTWNIKKETPMTNAIADENKLVLNTEVFFHTGSEELNTILDDLITGGFISTKLLKTATGYYFAIYPDQKFNTRRMLKCVDRLIQGGYMTHVEEDLEIEDPYDNRYDDVPDPVYLKLTRKGLVAIGAASVNVDTTPGQSDINTNTDAAVDEFVLQHMTPYTASVFMQDYTVLRNQSASPNHAFIRTLVSMLDHAARVGCGDVK